MVQVMKKVTLAVILAAAVAVALPASAVAQQSQNPQPPNQMQRQGQQPDKDSQKFIKAVIEGNNAEIEVGKLAQQKGQTDAVKQYGAMLVKDHGDANTKALQVAHQLNVEPPTGTSLGQKATYAKLKVLSGGSFDTSFAKSMVSDHQSDIKEYQQQAQKSDPAGDFAKETLPTLQKHLDQAQKLEQQVNQKQSSR
jgi:putative membrane protein